MGGPALPAGVDRRARGNKSASSGLWTMSKDIGVGAMSPSKSTARYWLYAACRIEFARDCAETAQKVALLRMARAWEDLAKRVEHDDRSLQGSAQKISPAVWRVEQSPE